MRLPTWMCESLLAWACKRAEQVMPEQGHPTLSAHQYGAGRLRWPDLIVGEPENPYLLRWHLIPRNRWLNIYLHYFLRSDDDRALHDHPWRSASIILDGPGYFEHTAEGRRWHPAGSLRFRSAKAAHRVELATDEWWWGFGRRPSKPMPVWTLFITGPKVREWGFHCPKGWRHWREYVKVTPGGNAVGRGCDD